MKNAPTSFYGCSKNQTLGARYRVYPQRCSHRAMTLVEVLISMGIFSLMALGVLSATIQSRRIAELNVMESTAAIVAQSCLEKLKIMDYNALRNENLTLMDPVDTDQTIILTQNTWNRLPRAIDINNTPDNTSDDLIIELNPQTIYLPNDTSAPIAQINCYEIFLNYRFQSRVFGTAKWQPTNSLRAIILPPAI